MDNGVEARGGHVVVEQVLQTVAADDAPSVVENGQSRVEVGVVSQQIFHKFRVETVVDEELLVGLEEDVGAVFLVSGAFGVADEYPLFEGGFAHFSVAYAAGHESHRERIDGFQTHPFIPTEAVNTAVSYLPPVLSFETASTSAPRGMPRP